MIKKNIVAADLGLFITALVWGSGFVAVKSALDNLSPMYIMISRFGLAWIFIMVVFHKKLKQVKRTDLKPGIIIGSFLFLGFATQTIGLQYTLAGKQAFLTGTNVVMVPFIFWLVKKEKTDIYNLVSAFLMFIGIGLLTLNHTLGAGLNKGDLLTLLCAFFFACHIVSIGIYVRKYDPIILTMIQFGVTCILSVIWMGLFEDFNLFIPTDGLFEIIFLACFSTFLAFLLQNICQKHTTPSHAAIILSQESFIGSILSILLLGDIFTSKMIIGCIMIFLAIITAETKWNFIKKKSRISPGEIKEEL
ncbi:MAG: DMT family transporter [Eubacteriales bacterium]